MEVVLLRTDPIYFNDDHISGYLENFPLDDRTMYELVDAVVDRHGGGSYSMLFSPDVETFRSSGEATKCKNFTVPGVPVIPPEWRRSTVTKPCDCPLLMVMNQGCKNPDHV